MSFGTHTNLVQEVLDFAKSGNLLRPGGLVQDDRWIIIASLEEAKVLAWQSPCGTHELLWTDIREKAMSGVKAETYSHSGFEKVRDDLAKQLQVLTMAVKRRLNEEHRDLLDDVVGDLFNCAFNRAINGTADLLFERMFSIYRVGGWPCGWQGDYPDGKVLAYFPSRG